MIKVLIVEDHPIFRAGVNQVLQTTHDIVTAGEASTVAEALALIEQLVFDVVLLDITLPDGDGMAFLKQLESRRPHAPVLVLTMHAEAEYAIRALRAGAWGYLTKDRVSEELIRAIRAVAAGHRYISTSLSERLAGEIGKYGIGLPHESLSEREYQVFRLMATGRTPRDIAHDLSLSVKTVGAHRSRILEKMNMRTNAELVAYAVRQGLAD